MIDDLARQLAQPMPRRRALRLMAGALAATAIPGVRPAAAAVSSCGALGCGGKCCSATDWSIPGKQGVCCDDDAVCCSGGHRAGDPSHTYGWCCPAGQTCGQEIGDCVRGCPSPNFECGTDCCGRDQACCWVHDQDDPICCPEGVDCAKQIQPGNIALTADSPWVCCPPERLVTAFTATTACCPPGSVRQPGGGLSTDGGFCCTAANVCGTNCCDSLPSFPKRCVAGGRCEFELLLVDKEKVTAQRNGSVKVPLKIAATTSAKVSIVVPAGGKASALHPADAGTSAAAARPKVLGSATLRHGKPGRRSVQVRLNRDGRRLLRRRGMLHAQVQLTLRDGKQQTSTLTPVTLRRPR